VRVIYGVFGYGRGHATRALATLPVLARRHELMVLAGGDAFELLRERYRVHRLPTLGYVYADNGSHSLWGTLSANAGPVTDAVFEGPVARRLRQAVEAFRPHVAVSDADVWTHQLAGRLGLPRIGFDHIGMLAHCRVEVPRGWRWALARDVSVYRLMMGKPDRVVVSSFFPVSARRSNVRCVGPLLRPAALEARPSDENYVLAYFNRGQHQVSARIEAEFRALHLPVVMYGSDRRGRRGNIDFRAPSDAQFIRDLAGCRAVVSTAGNQLVGECVHFRKPLLVIPENCLEQQVNAAAVERFGIGRRVDRADFDADCVRQLLRARREHVAALDVLAQTTLPDALVELERNVLDLGRSSRATFARSWKYA